MNASFYAHQRKLQDKTNTKQVYFSNLSLPKLSDTAPEPLPTVPFNRDSDFMGRQSLLNQLHEKYGSRDSPCLVLVEWASPN